MELWPNRRNIQTIHKTDRFRSFDRSPDHYDRYWPFSDHFGISQAGSGAVSDVFLLIATREAKNKPVITPESGSDVVMLVLSV